jgi:Flp pilus assembly protein TadB
MGIFYILCGVLLVLFPQLLAFIVALMFVFLGVSMIYMSHYYKRTAHRFDDPVIDFMFRL